MKLNLKIHTQLFLSLVLFSKLSWALDIDEYMDLAKKKNPLLRSYEASIESAELKSISAEADLAPLLTAGYLSQNDKSRPSQIGTSRELEIYSLGLSKKFQTGTSVKIDAQSGKFTNQGVIFPGFDNYSTGSLGVTLEQSLWKDFFGVGTRTKISRLQKLSKLEKLSQDLQSRAALYDVEANFWDYVLATEDFKLKKSNLERAQKIEKWTSNRFSNGISDRADVMNARALVAVREAQLIAAEEELKSQDVKLRGQIQLGQSEATPEIKANLNAARPYLTQLMKAKHVEKIESQIAILDSESKALISLEADDGIKPDLSVFASYATTSYNSDRSQSLKDITKTDYPKNALGVNFSWYLGTPDSIAAYSKSAKKDALAAQLKAEKKKTDSDDSWNEIKRKYEVTQRTVNTLEKVANFQRERAKAEQEKLSRGRTITANVVTAETDAAEAEVTLLKTKTNLRKLEASSLFFVSQQE